MTDDGDMSVIGHVMQSDDELMATVAELWTMVQHHRRKIEVLEAHLGLKQDEAGDIDIA